MNSKNQVKLVRNSKPWLIGASAAIVAGLTGATLWFYSNQSSEKYWQVTGDLPIGTEISYKNLKPLSASFPADAYLKSAKPPKGFLARSLRGGELLTQESVSESADPNLTRVVVSVNAPLSNLVQPGTVVGVWVAEKSGSDYLPASQVIEKAQVVREIAANSMFKSTALQVELAIEADLLPAILDAIAGESQIFLVPSN